MYCATVPPFTYLAKRTALALALGLTPIYAGLMVITLAWLMPCKALGSNATALGLPLRQAPQTRAVRALGALAVTGAGLVVVATGATNAGVAGVAAAGLAFLATMCGTPKSAAKSGGAHPI